MPTVTTTLLIRVLALTSATDDVAADLLLVGEELEGELVDGLDDPPAFAEEAAAEAALLAPEAMDDTTLETEDKMSDVPVAANEVVLGVESILVAVVVSNIEVSGEATETVLVALTVSVVEINEENDPGSVVENTAELVAPKALLVGSVMESNEEVVACAFT
jgi:hypothetical protein